MPRRMRRRSLSKRSVPEWGVLSLWRNCKMAGHLPPRWSRVPAGMVIDMAPAGLHLPDIAFRTLQQFARKEPQLARCEICSRELNSEHEHLIEPRSRKLACACDPCAILFEAQNGAKYKRVPRRVLFLRDFQLTDAQWEAMSLPIEMVFFLKSTPENRVMALYPSPAGPTESQLSLETWTDLESMNPVLLGMKPDVTALLVNRVDFVRGGGAAEYYLTPIDECYKLVGLIRTCWRGFSGGTEVWREINEFFGTLKRKAALANGAQDA